MTKIVEGSEDCLYLNVYTKSLNPNLRRPVMVWIHGGAFLMGDGSDSVYGPDYFLRKDIVFVTFNYRLSVLGNMIMQDRSINILLNNSEQITFSLSTMQLSMKTGSNRTRGQIEHSQYFQYTKVTMAHKFTVS